MSYLIIKCRKCGEKLITRDGQASKRCPACNVTMRLHHHQAGKNTREWRVVVLARFDTAQEAGDALRYIKLPREMRDPTATDLYQSTMWRS